MRQLTYLGFASLIAQILETLVSITSRRILVFMAFNITTVWRSYSRSTCKLRSMAMNMRVHKRRLRHTSAQCRRDPVELDDEAHSSLYLADIHNGFLVSLYDRTRFCDQLLWSYGNTCFPRSQRRRLVSGSQLLYHSVLPPRRVWDPNGDILLCGNTCRRLRWHSRARHLGNEWCRWSERLGLDFHLGRLT